MTLSREEIAVRVLCALAGRDGYGTDTATADAVIYADTLLRNLALTPTPTPVAPPAGKYEPRPGDVVRFVGMRHAVDDVDDTQDRLLVRVEDPLPERDQWVAYGLTNGNVAKIFPTREWWSYLRPGTSHELAAAGLAVPPPASTPAPEDDAAADARIDAILDDRKDADAIKAAAVRQRAEHRAMYGPEYPAPEAKRPEWVRYVGATTDAQKAAPRRVLEWVEDRAFVGCASDTGVVDENRRIMLWPSEWEPCDPPAPCPPPVAGSAEKDEAFVKAASAYCAVNYLPTYDESRVRLHHAMIEAWGAYARPVRP